VRLSGLWRLAKTAIYSFSTFPVFVFSLLGYSALAVFALLSVYSLTCRLFTGMAVPGWTSTVLVASFFGAVNALGISMLGEYVARIYDQVRGRPLYVIDKTINVRRGTLTEECLSDAEKDRAYEQLLKESDELVQMADEVLVAPQPPQAESVEHQPPASSGDRRRKGVVGH
jgi:dolichol-phosphate mannosyltransferase